MEIHDPKINFKLMVAAGAVGGLVVFVILLGFVWLQPGLVAGLVSQDPELKEEIKSEELIREVQEESGFEFFDRIIIDAVEKSNPAVVSIISPQRMPEFRGWPMFDFEPQRQESGSGFIATSSGLIVTNRHVVHDLESEYTVLTNDGERHRATVVDKDPFLDIAVLEIEGEDLPFLDFGDSDQLKLGQTVIAIGNALGELRNTVSTGVISGLSRSVVAGDRRGRTELLDEVIQTDAAINPGNSGGPLLNLAGEVIGVNVAIAASGQNIGFALPANPVFQVVDSVVEHGRIVRPFLGVRYVEVTPELARLNDLSVEHGALILGDEAVMPNSPAAQVGLKEGDVIVTWNDEDITSDRSLARAVRLQSVGDEVSLTVDREGEILKFEVTLEEMPR